MTKIKAYAGIINNLINMFNCAKFVSDICLEFDFFFSLFVVVIFVPKPS